MSGADGSDGAQGADGIMDVVSVTPGFAGTTGAATGNAGGMFYLMNDGNTGPQGDANGYFFNNSDDLTGQRWEFFNDEPDDDVIITFGNGTYVNGQQVLTASRTITVSSGDHVTVMAISSNTFIAWFSTAANLDAS
jgi:hypothetical protein